MSKETDKPRQANAAKHTDEEKRAALELVIACGGNITEAARRANISRKTLDCWTRGENVSEELHADYAKSSRARVAKRLDDLHASKEEVLSLLATHLRADLADLSECFNEVGQLDLAKAKEQGVSRLVKKLKHTRRPVRGSDGAILDYEHQTDIEVHDAQSAAAKLMQIHGLVKQPGENPQDAENRRAFWRQQIEEISASLNGDEAEAKAWLFANVPEARSESQWIN